MTPKQKEKKLTKNDFLYHYLYNLTKTQTKPSHSQTFYVFLRQIAAKMAAKMDDKTVVKAVVKTLQELCCIAIAKKQTSSLAQIEQLPLSKHLRALLATTREKLIITPDKVIYLPNRYNIGFWLAYCCPGIRIGRVGDDDYDVTTNNYFNMLYMEHIKSYSCDTIESEHSGYMTLRSPFMIDFTTVTGDTYNIRYDAYTCGDNVGSNWNRTIRISGITYSRNYEPAKKLKFMFVSDTGCSNLIKNGITSKYDMSYIALDKEMNYKGHYFTPWTHKSDKHAHHVTKQFAELFESHKSSKLPFIVYFLEFIPDPIMRLIYLFTYMPSIYVKSGK